MTHAIALTSDGETVPSHRLRNVTRMIASSWSALSVKPGIHVWSRRLRVRHGNETAHDEKSEDRAETPHRHRERIVAR